ncbi:hypothetical protein ACP70R_006036 [Stipagrostis hirtigluma subsp. patula]
MASLEPFNRLVRLAARAFYADEVTTKGDTSDKNPRKPSRGGGSSGLAVVVLDALTRRQWVREDDLARDLKLHAKQLRRVLRFLEEEKLVARDHRKEPPAKGPNFRDPAAAAASGDDQPATKEPEEKKPKMHTHSYCSLDYAQTCDVVRYRMHRMEKKLKDELDGGSTIQHYICPGCNKRYSAFDALQLVSYTDECFHCEACDGELVAEGDGLASGGTGGGGGGDDDGARKRRREKLQDMQRRMEEQLKPLVLQLERVKGLPAPEFGSLRSWERANGGPGAVDPYRSSQGQYGASMPYFEVEFAVPTDVKVQAPQYIDADVTNMKVLPPWMITKGMNLTEEQRGETSSTLEREEKSEDKDDIKAYYEALLGKAQEETSAFESERQVGKKCKRENEEDGGIEWEEELAAANTSETYNLADLNVEAQESGDNEDGVD